MGIKNFGLSSTATSTAIVRRGGVDQIITARLSNKKFEHDAMHTPHMSMTTILTSYGIRSIFTDSNNFIATLLSKSSLSRASSLDHLYVLSLSLYLFFFYPILDCWWIPSLYNWLSPVGARPAILIFTLSLAVYYIVPCAGPCLLG
ncbi:hypothetical protein F5B22DRAFT_213721 [Xylaria bambusicola]|uniref:uncharacterized protein n=1 Tax=Xylaria bambusicola TaxID=326684 RepID=UPI0020083BC9|nr:uncharacterized protein F5B22DRAFT_213721 [Xylaria bambusicola]KAI0515028.1 hypothetical protein F5B22DRAFT_213721 [Xylaria bambusicola]